VNTGFIILISALVAASLTDIAHRRIPNAITYPLAAFGLLYHFPAVGMNGLIFSLSGILAGAGLLLLFHLLGGMGAGDVKLMAAVGAILGPADVLARPLAEGLGVEAAGFGRCKTTVDMDIGMKNFVQNGPKVPALFLHE
jgi:Flp pilus assembly protein protease CpaA